MLIVRRIIGRLLTGQLVGNVGLERRDGRGQIGGWRWGVRGSGGRGKRWDRVGILRIRWVCGGINRVIRRRIAGGEGWCGGVRTWMRIRDGSASARARTRVRVWVLEMRVLIIRSRTVISLLHS